MSDYDKNGELHHNLNAPLDPAVESVFDHIQDHQRLDDSLSNLGEGDTLIFPREEMEEFQKLRRTYGLTVQNYALTTHALEKNLKEPDDQSDVEPSIEKQVDDMYAGNAVPVLLKQIRKPTSDQDLREQIAKEKNEAKHVLQILNERMRACEDWLRLLGDTKPTLKRRISGTAFFPMAATGLLRDFDNLWKNFWTIRLRRELPIPESPPDERLLNQASSHAFRCEHGDQDIEFLKTLPFRRQVAIEYYSHIEQYFQDPLNKKTKAIIAVFQDDTRYFRVRLPRQEWFEQTPKETAVREIEGILLSLDVQQGSRVAPAAQRELKAATYGKHKESSQNPLLRKIFGHEATEQTMVFLEPENIVDKENRRVKQLLDTVNDSSFFTGEHVARVVKPWIKIDTQTKKRVITASDIGVTHRDWDGVQSQQETVKATSDLANKYRHVEGDSLWNRFPADPIEDSQLENYIPTRVVLTEKFDQRTVPLESYQKIRGKLELVRQLYEVPRGVKEKLQCASSFTLPDIIQLACHSLGMEAGQMVVMQKSTSESLLDVAFSLANDDLLRLAKKVVAGEATREERHDYAKAVLGTSSRFMREKAWAMQGKGSASFFATLAGQKRRLEWVSKAVGDRVVGKRFVDGVNRQQFMISVPSNTSTLLEKRPDRSRVTSFYSAQTDSLAMDATTQIDGIGAVGIVDSPAEGLVLSIRTMPDQSWKTIQEAIRQILPTNDTERNLVIAAYRELVFKGNDQMLQELPRVLAKPLNLESLHVFIEDAIQVKIHTQLADLERHIDVVLDALIMFAADNNKHPRKKFQLFSPQGELDGWKTQLEDTRDKNNEARVSQNAGVFNGIIKGFAALGRRNH
ncbi:hypothetical protein KBD71_04745 [Candidatus Woesebacteria bacterium]|nr:hypothetical protein [Candidatus Woesebacteria bacterium]